MHIGTRQSLIGWGTTRKENEMKGQSDKLKGKKGTEEVEERLRKHLVKDCAYTHAQDSVQGCVSMCLYKVVVRVWVCMHVSARARVCVFVFSAVTYFCSLCINLSKKLLYRGSMSTLVRCKMEE